MKTIVKTEVKKELRKLTQVINAQPAQDGDGVNIHRLAGRRLHQALNPFLMIDEIGQEYEVYGGEISQVEYKGEICKLLDLSFN